MKTLILGGVKSGKSREAERLAGEAGSPITVIATALPGDDEMRKRIARHQRQRPAEWQVEEVPFELAAALDNLAAPPNDHTPGRLVIVDCLTLWLTQLLCAEQNPQRVDDTLEQLVQSVQRFSGTLILVSNESGTGVTPVDPLSRSYLDYAGTLHQRLAVICDCVTLMVAGIPMTIKGAPPAST